MEYNINYITQDELDKLTEDHNYLQNKVIQLENDISILNKYILNCTKILSEVLHCSGDITIFNNTNYDLDLIIKSIIATEGYKCLSLKNIVIHILNQVIDDIFEKVSFKKEELNIQYKNKTISVGDLNLLKRLKILDKSDFYIDVKHLNNAKLCIIKNQDIWENFKNEICYVQIKCGFNIEIK